MARVASVMALSATGCMAFTAPAERPVTVSLRVPWRPRSPYFEPDPHVSSLDKGKLVIIAPKIMTEAEVTFRP